MKTESYTATISTYTTRDYKKKIVDLNIILFKTSWWQIIKREKLMRKIMFYYKMIEKELK